MRSVYAFEMVWYTQGEDEIPGRVFIYDTLSLSSVSSRPLVTALRSARFPYDLTSKSIGRRQEFCEHILLGSGLVSVYMYYTSACTLFEQSNRTSGGV